MQVFTNFAYVDLEKRKIQYLKIDSTRHSVLPHLVPYSDPPCQDVSPISHSKSMREQ